MRMTILFRHVSTPFVLAMLAATGMLPVGCAPMAPPPPKSLAEYKIMRTQDPHAYARRTILLTNLQRALDHERLVQERMDSLRLVMHLGSNDPSVKNQLRPLLTESDCPYELRRSAAEFLNLPGYAIADVRPQPKSTPIPTPTPKAARGLTTSPGPTTPADVTEVLASSDQQDVKLQQMGRNPTPAKLNELVRMWAAEPSTTSADEPRYRMIAEEISGMTWQQALLEAMNSRGDFPRDLALEILVRRMPKESLRSRLFRLEPNTTGIAAMQSFAESLDYLPTTRESYQAVERLFSTRLEMIGNAAGVTSRWRRNYGYRFDVRDFHLTSRLSRDPLRIMRKRTQLILDVGRSLNARTHVKAAIASVPRNRVRTDSFPLQVESLSPSDLWNIYLLDEMLNRPRMRRALRVMSERNQADAGSSRDGLIFYRQDQIEAMLYPATATGVNAQLVYDGYDALCRFTTHFEKLDNAGNAGPSLRELRQAKAGNYYGVILTSINELAFSAHYYNPKGQVVSLGKFPFKGANARSANSGR